MHVFPVKTKTGCRLKWSHSTVFLTINKTSSCHRVDKDDIPDNFDFHNTPEKLVAREKMLRGEWPGKGCEHCSLIELAGGTSDRMIHLDPNYFESDLPPELNPEELFKLDAIPTQVTPTEIEVYFSNYCNLSCTYCGDYFSTTWEAENKKFGHIEVTTGDRPEILKHIRTENEHFSELKNLDKFLNWLDGNMYALRWLHILGGEPFIQPQTDQFLDLLETKSCPKLQLSFFSNLSNDHKKIVEKATRLQRLVENHQLQNIVINASMDCWGKEAEYTRYGLDLELFQKNFEYLLHNTSFDLNINMCWSPLSTFTMPDLMRKINYWSSLILTDVISPRVISKFPHLSNDNYRSNQSPIVQFSLMQAAGKDYMHPSIFGPQILDWGYKEFLTVADFLFNVQPMGINKDYLIGIMKSIEKSEPNKQAQLKLHNYLTELDRRRGTNYPSVFPILYEAIHP